MSATESPTASGTALRAATPSANWRASGEADPHGTRYDCDRAQLMMGNLTDDEMANAVYLHGDARPSVQEVLAGKAQMPTVYLAAAKDRIRWLSRQLEAALARPTAPDTVPTNRGASEVAALRALNDRCVRSDEAWDERRFEEAAAAYVRTQVLASPAPDPQAGSDSPAASGAWTSDKVWESEPTPPPAVPATRDAGLDRAPFRTGDLVRHKPSDEIWTVAYCAPASGYLAACGHPFTEVLISDCVLHKAANDQEHQGTVKAVLAAGGVRAARLRHLIALAPTPGKAPGQDAVKADQKPCFWSGGNDVIWCATCGAEYAYAKGEQRPPCPREPTALAAIRATQADTGGAEAQRAIRFALAIDDHYNVRDFLDGWLKGDTSEWPEFAEGAERPRDEDEDDVPAPTPLATDGEG